MHYSQATEVAQNVSHISAVSKVSNITSHILLASEIILKHFYMQRSSAMTPTKACTKDNEGESVNNPLNPLSIWLCKSLAWKPYE